MLEPRKPSPWIAAPRRRIVLMRHAEVDYFDDNGKPFKPHTVPLNAEGRLQAQHAARELAGTPFDRAVSSGLLRSVETATFVSGHRDLVIEHCPELREIEPGRLADLEAACPGTIEKAFLGALACDLTPETRFLGGESFGSLSQRVWPCFQDLLADRQWQHLLIVGHGVVNRLILSQILGMSLSCLGTLEQDAGCINLIDVDDAGHCLVRLINYTPVNPVKTGMELTTLERLYLQFCKRRSGTMNDER
jgi:broad specificity phosphatase PhoE